MEPNVSIRTLIRKRCGLKQDAVVKVEKREREFKTVAKVRDNRQHWRRTITKETKRQRL